MFHMKLLVSLSMLLKKNDLRQKECFFEWSAALMETVNWRPIMNNLFAFAYIPFIKAWPDTGKLWFNPIDTRVVQATPSCSVLFTLDFSTNNISHIVVL